MHRYIVFFFLLTFAACSFTGCSLLQDVGAIEERTVRVEKVDPVTGETYVEVTTEQTLNPEIATAAEKFIPSPWGQIGGAVVGLGSLVLAAVTRKRKREMEEALKATVKNVEKLPEDAKAEIKKNQKLDTSSKGKKIIDDLVAS